MDQRERSVRHHQRSRTLFSKSPNWPGQLAGENGRTPNRPFQAKVTSSKRLQ